MAVQVLVGSIVHRNPNSVQVRGLVPVPESNFKTRTWIWTQIKRVDLNRNWDPNNYIIYLMYPIITYMYLAKIFLTTYEIWGGVISYLAPRVWNTHGTRRKPLGFYLGSWSGPEPGPGFEWVYVLYSYWTSFFFFHFESFGHFVAASIPSIFSLFFVFKLNFFYKWYFH